MTREELREQYEDETMLSHTLGARKGYSEWLEDKILNNPELIKKVHDVIVKEKK